MNFFLILFCLSLASIYLLSACNESVMRDDIYIDRLVYLKRNNRLLTGHIKETDDISTYKMNFKEGIPLGKWSEYDKHGGLIQRRKYLNMKELSKDAQELFAGDTVAVDYWQEGELNINLHPQFLTITILRSNSFFLHQSKI